ncbi:MAG TPA: MurT ligase domain-containing protein [Chloroflexota bacterium]|nr:MurT ligase domain-containing protein [Chloroflexota bacterium]
MRLRRAAAVNAARLAAAVSRASGRGGTALPGLVATAMDPDIIAALASQLPVGSVIVAGTNGKTTTSRMLAAIVTSAGMKPVRNESGSNLARGLAASLVRRAGPTGNLARADRAVGLFETDEAALPAVIRSVRPRILVLLNLFRDQLDRYGEVATIAGLWKGALQELTGATIVANADDPLVAHLVQTTEAPHIFFGIQSAPESLSGLPHAADVKACPNCGAPIDFSVTFVGHLGHYICRTCGFSRPAPQVAAEDVRLNGVDGSLFAITDSDERISVALPLPGLYNVYNATAAAAAACALGIRLCEVRAGLENVTPAFGRMERLEIDGRHVYLALAKNPTGLNEVLRTIESVEQPLFLLPMLNDNIADGRDVSWIWDADVEMLRGRVASATFSGTRAADMALRFKYAGVTAPAGSALWSIEPDPEHALRSALSATPRGERLFVLPTYTALLQMRGVLTRCGLARPYWEE